MKGTLRVFSFAREDAAGEPEAGDGGEKGARDVGEGVEEAGVDDPAEDVEEGRSRNEGEDGLLLEIGQRVAEETGMSSHGVVRGCVQRLCE